MKTLELEVSLRGEQTMVTLTKEALYSLLDRNIPEEVIAIHPESGLKFTLDVTKSLETNDVFITEGAV